MNNVDDRNILFRYVGDRVSRLIRQTNHFLLHKSRKKKRILYVIVEALVKHLSRYAAMAVDK